MRQPYASAICRSRSEPPARNGPHPGPRGQDEPIAALLLIPALIAAGIAVVWMMRAAGSVIDPYRPASVWVRAGLFFVVAW
ncbi:MAG: hypothetical protein ACERLM_16830, partial [Acidimicrobiales bacterium]